MVRLAIVVLLVIVVYKLLSSLVKGLGTSDRQEATANRNTAELIQDPQCGAYILPAQGVATQVNGKTYHFCSEGCRDEFLLEFPEDAGKKAT
ncbi:MAG: YHS domain-containing protein [Deltaproteobacteria bacterium]|nr:YHS domain-containing protein [Deltaproteobacteria bacterium]